MRDTYKNEHLSGGDEGWQINKINICTA